jgi:hypothetical protein
VENLAVQLASEDRHSGCDDLGLASLSLASGCIDVLSFLKLIAQHLGALVRVAVAALVLALGFSDLSGKLERSMR